MHFSLAGSSLALLVAVAAAQPKPRLELCDAVARYLLLLVRCGRPGTWHLASPRKALDSNSVAVLPVCCLPAKPSRSPSAGDPISKFPSPATAEYLQHL